MNKNKNILLLPKWRYTFSSIFKIAKNVESHGYSPVFLIFDFKEQDIKYIKKNNWSYVVYNKNRYNHLPPLLGDIKLKNFAKKILTQYRPLAVVGFTSFKPLIRQANLLKIPTITVSWALSLRQKDYNKQRTHLISKYGKKVTKNAFIFNFNSLVNKTKLQIVLAKLNMRFKIAILHFFPKTIITKIKRIFQVDYKHPKCFGDSEEKLLLTIGKGFKEQFNSQGVSKGKIKTVGLIEHDYLFNFIKNNSKQKIKIKLSKKFNINSSKKIIYWAPRPSVEDGYGENDVKEQEKTVIKSILQNCGQDVKILITLHPRASVETFKSWLPNDNRIIFLNNTTEEEIIMLYYSADIFISTYSTTILSAIACDTNVITYNMLNIPGGDYFKTTVKGVLHADTKKELDDILKKITSNEKYKQELSIERKIARKKWMRFDGKTTERIYNAITNEIKTKK